MSTETEIQKLKEALKPQVIATFNTHSSIDKLLMLSNGCAFTEENLHKAQAEASKLQVKDIITFNRSDVFAAPVAFKESEDTETSSAQAEEEVERADLVAKYEELFGEKPAHNIGLEKLKKRIADKEQEIANA